MAVATTALIGWPSAATAREGTAEQVVEAYYGVLLDVMRNAKTLGYQGRYKTLEPVIMDTFDLPQIARSSVSRGVWTALTEAQKQSYVAAYERFSVATYASRFDDYTGEKFEIVKTEETRRKDKLVRTQIVKSNGEEVPVNYLLRKRDGTWRVIDVFLKGTISEVATRRADFSATIRDKGFDGLIAAIDDKVKELAAE